MTTTMLAGRTDTISTFDELMFSAAAMDSAKWVWLNDSTVALIVNDIEAMMATTGAEVCGADVAFVAFVALADVALGAHVALAVELVVEAFVRLACVSLLTGTNTHRPVPLIPCEQKTRSPLHVGQAMLQFAPAKLVLHEAHKPVLGSQTPDWHVHTLSHDVPQRLLAHAPHVDPV